MGRDRRRCPEVSRGFPRIGGRCRTCGARRPSTWLATSSIDRTLGFPGVPALRGTSPQLVQQLLRVLSYCGSADWRDKRPTSRKIDSRTSPAPVIVAPKPLDTPGKRGRQSASQSCGAEICQTDREAEPDSGRTPVRPGDALAPQPGKGVGDAIVLRASLGVCVALRRRRGVAKGGGRHSRKRMTLRPALWREEECPCASEVALGTTARRCGIRGSRETIGLDSPSD